MFYIILSRQINLYRLTVCNSLSELDINPNVNITALPAQWKSFSIYPHTTQLESFVQEQWQLLCHAWDNQKFHFNNPFRSKTAGECVIGYKSSLKGEIW